MSVLLKDQWLYTFGPFTLDPSRRVLTRSGTALSLSKKAFDLLLYLVENPNRVVDKEELLATIWPGRVVEESNLSQTIFTLRKVLDGGDPTSRVIATSPGRGYRMDVPVTVTSRESDSANASPKFDGLFAASSTQGSVTANPSANDSIGRMQSTPYKRKRGAMAAICVVVIAVAAFAFWEWQKAGESSTASRSVVLARFANETGDPALDSVLDRILDIDISQSPFITPVPTSKVTETLQLMGKSKDEKLTVAIAREVCRRNSGQATINGAAAMLGQRYVITLAAYDCVTGDRIIENKAEASTKEDILPAIDDLTARIRNGIGESTASVQNYSVPLAQATTASFDALQAFSQGLQARAHGDDTGALALHQRAIELDPAFAMAYIELGVIHRSRHEQDIGNAYLKKAYELKDRVGEHERVRISALYQLSIGNTRGMIDAYKAWVRAYPGDWPPWANLANVYTDLGHYAEAIEAGKEAVRRMPEHGGPYFVLARAYTRASRLDEAKAVCARAIKKNLDGWDIHNLLYEIAFVEHDKATMASLRERMSAEAGDDQVLELDAFVAAASGKVRQAKVLFDRAIVYARSHPSESVAVVGYFVDEIDAAANSGSQKEALAAALLAEGLESNEFAPIVLAKAGDSRRARELADKLARRNPDDITAVDIDIPAAAAAIDLHLGLATKAIADLQPALPYEFRNLEVPSLLAQAYLDAKMPERAAAEYRKILANPGVDPISMLLPLAHLGLARAEARLGHQQLSRDEYTRFADLWKDADEDVSIVADAHAEADALTKAN